MLETRLLLFFIIDYFRSARKIEGRWKVRPRGGIGGSINVNEEDGEDKRDSFGRDAFAPGELEFGFVPIVDAAADSSTDVGASPPQPTITLENNPGFGFLLAEIS